MLRAAFSLGPGAFCASALARALEAGRYQGRAARLLSGAWARAAEPARPLSLPLNALVIGVGGATLGGSHKTPVVVQLARDLSRRFGNDHVAVVGHAYKATPRGALRVSPERAVEQVGDEALWLSRALPCPVFVAHSRQAALDLALTARPSFVVVDGLLQARPRRVGLSLLVVEGDRPWGSGACPPQGDLRAMPRDLLKCCDVILRRRSAHAAGEPTHLPLPEARPVLDFSTRIDGALDAESGAWLGAQELAALRLGLVTAVARPERIERDLSALGVQLRRSVRLGDHGHLPAAHRLATTGLDAWLTTPKCTTKLAATLGGLPVLILQESLGLPDSLLLAFERTIESRSGPTC